MELTPRLTGALALLALVPVGVYVYASGELTLVTGTIAFVNVLVIATSILLMFGPDTPAASEGSAH